MNIASLGLHITDRCNAKCLHCAFGCGPKIEGSMGLKEAKRYVADAKTLDTETVCISGGEPMLYPSLVEKIVSESSRLSFSEIWLFTNGFWALDMHSAHAITEKLSELGLTKMFTSIDVFHQSHVPIESVKNAIEASLESNLEVCVDARFIGELNEENEFKKTTRALLDSLGNILAKVEVIKTQPLFVGRAAESLATHIKMKPLSEILEERCPGAWAGGTLEAPLGVDVDEFGFVTICPGLSIGNTRQTSFRKTIEKYDYREHVVIAALYDADMRGLKNLASEKGFVPKEAYANGCHFCYESRKFLRKIFPEAFAFIG